MNYKHEIINKYFKANVSSVSETVFEITVCDVLARLDDLELTDEQLNSILEKDSGWGKYLYCLDESVEMVEKLIENLTSDL